MAPLLSSGRPGGSAPSTRAQVTSIIIYSCAAFFGLAAAYLYLAAAPLASTRGAAEAERASRADFRVKPQQRAQAATVQGSGSSSSSSKAAAGGDTGGTARKSVTVAEDSEERKWFSKLSVEACAEAETHRVCSHRAKADLEGVAPGSLAAYAALWKAKIRWARPRRRRPRRRQGPVGGRGPCSRCACVHSQAGRCSTLLTG